MKEIFDLSRERVAVLCGGMSGEREVSLRSGANVHRALEAEGIPAVKIDVGRDVAEALVKSGATVAYIALHGRYGEDGAVQGLLELLGLPYTGPGVQASAICMDKGVTKRILAQEGLATPEWISVSRDASFSAEDAVRQLGLPVIVKPVAEGSSLGVVIIKRGEDLAAAVGTCLAANEAVSGRDCAHFARRLIARIEDVDYPEGFFSADFDQRRHFLSLVRRQVTFEILLTEFRYTLDFCRTARHQEEEDQVSSLARELLRMEKARRLAGEQAEAEPE